MKNILAFIIIVLSANLLTAQETSHSHSHLLNREIEFPDIDGYKTLICDFHQHTVFSDGYVWPTIRVQEAVKDGLDVISLTDHLEYQPHKEDIPHPDRNRAYEIALDEAEEHDLIVLNGSEITRSLPPGHSNAIFITDANKLLIDDPIDAFKEANNQGAFVFWNHPNWTSQSKDGIARLTDMHKQLLNQKLLHGIEVVNDATYSDEALQIALDNDLTMIGASDIHGLVDWKYEIPKGGHRPVTLVFAKERNEDSLKEALFNKQTVVYFNNILIGRDEFLVPLINASLSITEAAYIGYSKVLSIHIKNDSDVDFMLKNNSNFTFHNYSDLVSIKAQSTTVLEVKTLEIKTSLDLKFEVLNAILAPKAHPEITLNIEVKYADEFISDWQIIGPFENTDGKGLRISFPPEKEFIVNKTYKGLGGSKVKWRSYSNPLSEYIDFTKLFKMHEQGVTYAYRVFKMDEDEQVKVGIGSNDGVRMWLNGNLVLDHQTKRMAEPNQEILNLNFKKGDNTVLIKVDQFGAGWGFYFSVLEGDIK